MNESNVERQWNLKGMSWLLQTVLLLAPGSVFAQALAESSPDTLVEIVVTAEKRSDSLQKVPFSVTALSSAKLEAAGAQGISALVDLVPGVQISAQDSFPLITIRGVGAVSADAYADPAVSFNVDGVYEGKGTSPNGVFYDVARVEVLKGPQGTLYGRNATAGAINIVTNDPTQRAEESVELGVGNFGERRVEAMVNTPISDTLAIRFSGQFLQHEGYLSSGYNDSDDGAFRVKALWKPTGNVSLMVSADFFHEGGKGGSDVYYPFIDARHPWNQPAALTGTITNSQGSIPISQLVYQYGGNPVNSTPYYPTNGFTDNYNYGISSQLDWNLGPATLTVIPAVRKTRTDSMTPVTGLITELNFNDRQATLEARLSSNDDGGPLKWMTGVYYLNERDPSTSLYANSTFAELVIPEVGPVAQFLPINVATNYNYIDNVVPSLRSESAALFGQATYSLASNIRLTGGLRYTYDEKSQSGYSYTFDHYTTFPIVDNGTTAPQLESYPVSYPLVTRKSWDNVSYKIGLDADVAPKSLVYGNISTGYKAGGIYQNRPGDDTYKPETLLAFALGSKNTFLDGRLSLNGEVFYWIYKEHQLSAFVGDSLIPGAVIYADINAARATVEGFDIDSSYLLTRHDLLSISIEHLQARFTDFILPAGPAPAPAAAINYAGTSLPYTPHWNAVLAYEHTFQITDDYKLVAGADGRIVSRQFENFQSQYPEDNFHGYAKTNATLDFRSQSGQWNVMAWVHNISNVAVINYVNNVGQLPFFAGIEAPRTFGLTMAKNFH